MLSDEYKLDMGAKMQPPININNLLYKTYQYYSSHRGAFCNYSVLTSAQLLQEDDVINICKARDIN